MADKKTPKAAQEVKLLTTLELTNEQYSALASMTTGDQPDSEKAQSVVLKLVRDVADGGLLLTPDEVARITDATGVDPSCGEDLIPYLSAGSGIEEGCHIFKAAIDPVYMTRLEEIAGFREWPIQQVVQEMVDHCLENNWYEEITDQPRHVRMTEDDVKALEEVLEGKFSTGTELAELIKGLTSGSGLFAESEVEA